MSITQPRTILPDPWESDLPSEEEFMRLQDTDGSVRGYEMEDGSLIPVSPIDGRQSTAWGEFYFQLRLHLEQQHLGRIWLDVHTKLDEEGRFRVFPDMVYLANDVLHRMDGRRVNGAPTMVSEVTAGKSRKRDYGSKMQTYHRCGVEWYWIVDVDERRIHEYRHGAGGYEEVSTTSFGEPFRPLLFPGFELTFDL